MTKPTIELKATEIQCPVCGYYCLGKGGHGCIDKPSMVSAVANNRGEKK